MYQPASLAIWDSKYRLKDASGAPVDADMDATLARVAGALADVEPEAREAWRERFLWALRAGAVPAGRILSNAGAHAHKPSTSLINCTVARTIPDSMEGILELNKEAGLTLKAGCGIGYDFSTLRPRGAFVQGAGSSTSGPLSFMDIFDHTCRTVSSAGGRRGAQMGVMEVSHPDIEDFIRAKREPGRLRNFNLSVLISGDFLRAVEAGEDWPLLFPAHPAELRDGQCEIVHRPWPLTEGYETDAEGRVAMRVYRRVPARELWQLIMCSTYDFAEPGFLLIDEVNEMNNLWWCEWIRATNPCGEQPLPPEGACLLGSIDLTRFVRDPFTEQASFDSQAFGEVVRVFTRLLDNVVDIAGLPLPGQRREIVHKRRHGMGYFGLGSAMAMLCMPYGSAESLAFTERVTREMAVVGWQVGVELAREKGAAPVFDEQFTVTPRMLALRPEMVADGIKVGDPLPGRILFARYSRYMQRLAEVAPALVREIEQHGCRFSHHSSIAPTGTIALSFGNNASNGIEPSFSHRYTRNVIVPGRMTKEAVTVFSAELLAYREQVDAGADEGGLPDWFSTADVPPRAHVDVQAAAQRWVDSSISKTINVPADIPFEDFQHIYRYAASRGLKGCTTYRPSEEAPGVVLVKPEQLAATRYVFTLADGSQVELPGDAEIEYEGQIHTAANLHEALKQGYFGKL